MNVGGLPLTEDGGGFLWALAIIAVASALVYWLLKRSGTVGALICRAARRSWLATSRGTAR